MSITDRLEKEFGNYGIAEIVHPIFQHFPAGIRFEIGTGELYDEEGNLREAYASNALYRVNHIFEAAFVICLGNYIGSSWVCNILPFTNEYAVYRRGRHPSFYRSGFHTAVDADVFDRYGRVRTVEVRTS